MRGTETGSPPRLKLDDYYSNYVTCEGFFKRGAVKVTYATRPLPGGKFGIRVKTYRDGSLETDNMNELPWPTKALAFERARQAAESELEREAA